MDLCWSVCLYTVSGLKTPRAASTCFRKSWSLLYPEIFLAWLCDSWRSVDPVIITFTFTGVRSVKSFTCFFLFSSASMNYPWKWIRTKLESYLANKTVCCGVRGGAAIRAFKSAFSSSSSAMRLKSKSSMLMKLYFQPRGLFLQLNPDVCAWISGHVHILGITLGWYHRNNGNCAAGPQNPSWYGGILER